VPFTLVVEVLVLFADAQLPDAHHPQGALAAFDECPQQITARSRLVHLASGRSIALQLQLRFVKQLDGDDGRRFAPDPFALRAIASPRLEIPQLVFLRLAILRDYGLPIVVTRLPGIDTIRQDISDRGRLPDLVLARGRWRFGGVQTFGDLPTTQLFFHQRAIDVPHDFGCHGVEHHLRRATVTFREIAVAVTPVSPRDECAVPGFLQTSATGAFGNLGTLVLGDHPLHLGQSFALRSVAERILAKDQRRIHLLELLDQEPLMRIVPSQPIR